MCSSDGEALLAWGTKNHRPVGSAPSEIRLELDGFNRLSDRYFIFEVLDLHVFLMSKNYMWDGDGSAGK